MILYTCIGKNRDDAFENAVKKYGKKIGVVYEKEFIYGVFNKRWVEIGFFIRLADEKFEKGDLEASRSVFSLYVESEVERIDKVLEKNDFSLDFRNRITSQLTRELRINKKFSSISENDSFVYSLIKKYIKQYQFKRDEYYSLYILADPFFLNIEPIANNIFKKLCENESFKNNREMRLFIAQVPYKADVDTTDFFMKEISECIKKNIFCFLAVSFDVVNMLLVVEKIKDIETQFAVSSSSSILFPSYIKTSDAISIAREFNNFNNIVFHNDPNTKYKGNFLSIASFLEKGIEYITDTEMALRMDEFDLQIEGLRHDYFY